MPANTLFHNRFQRIQGLRPKQGVTQVGNFVGLMTGVLESRLERSPTNLSFTWLSLQNGFFGNYDTL